MSAASLDIAFFGSSLVSAYWNGAATYYRGIIRQLARRGHRVTFYEPDAFERQKHRDIADPPWCEVCVYSGTDQRDVTRVLERARRADVLVKASGVGVWDALLEDAIPRMTRAGALSVFWDVDAPATLARMNADPADALRSAIPRYDAVFTYGGGRPVIDAYVALGARQCVPIYNALDPDTHFRVAADVRFSGDVALLANRLPDRESRIDTFFFDPAKVLSERTFLLGGNGWQDRAVPANVRTVGHVYTADHNAFNSSTLAVLNVARDSMASVGWSPATRVFEAAGAAACVVSDAWPGLDDFLEPGREILVAVDAESMAATIRSLIPSRARAIGEAARQRVLAEHTYAIRALEVERHLLEGSPATKRATS